MFDRWLVVSDMDGTLLNHHNYRVKAALSMLQKLESSSIPVIFNTSKTFAELKDWVALLNNRHPFIVENGSAIYIPENYFADKFSANTLSDAKSESGYRIIVTGIEIQSIAEYVKKIAPDAIDLSRCSLQQAVEITGLTESEAR
ncbi:MAG: HAD-IIB family hydrolase, partial [Gammaproteobacteria bacterium]|nr:HAD-IIB family hydrolase [Gammaproteobacteria bacterium]